MTSTCKSNNIKVTKQSAESQICSNSQVIDIKRIIENIKGLYDLIPRPLGSKQIQRKLYSIKAPVMADRLELTTSGVPAKCTMNDA